MLYREMKLKKVINHWKEERKARAQPNESHGRPDQKDFNVMILAAILTLLPAAIAVIFIIVLALTQFF